MDNNIISNLKSIFKPSVVYYGEWDLVNGLEEISLTNKKDKKLYNEFLERYYYMPLNVIFKDDDLVRNFKYNICSRMSNTGRNLYFSKRTFLSNVISNIDEILLEAKDEDQVYKNIKKALRDKKDMYRDVEKLGNESEYYKDIKNEYKECNIKMDFDDFVVMCKKKYTRLLSGYNALLEFFDKPLNVDKLIDCFDPVQLYLFVGYSILKYNEKNYDLYGKVDCNISCIDTYRDIVDKLRKEDEFYNSHISIGDKVYTIDDLFKEYDKLMDTVNG